ncbi:MAG: hypothetical protein LC808_24870 [Actinobacteria bacterium]|nr:hypothetical protein [Actinomycetota bacterium]
MATRPVRVPEPAYVTLKSLSGLLDTTPGDLIQVALGEYMANHGQELNELFRYAQKFLAAGDADSLVRLLENSRAARAKAAAESVAAAWQPD